MSEEYKPAPEENLAPVPDDTGDTRGAHLRHLIAHPATLIIAGVLAAATLIAVGTQAGWALGGGGAAVVVLIVLIVVWVIANNQAREDFFNAYAGGRGLARVPGRSSLPPVTPLLQKGDNRYAEQRFNGVLPGGMDGSLCLYTYEEISHDSDGNRETTYVHYTIAMTQLPQTAAYLQELFCQRRVGFRFMDSAEDVFRHRQRVEQESEAVDKAYEIFIGAKDDMNKARQVLSPSFLVWLDAHSPEAYAFELCAGSLVCNVKGHKKSSAELDDLCQASAAVARRLSEEAAEVIPPT
ncbi:MAG: hypothetical protein QOI10_2302 [Solirubrobacterales bacterium]|jgi:hypothetical protein|nr:hypothetical protein [Solirubrobacterales bacterium]